MPFTTSTAELSPFLSVLWLLTHPIIFWDMAKGGCFLLPACVTQWFLLPCSCCLHWLWSHCTAPDEIHFDSVICLWTHKPIHCRTLLCKLIRSSQRTMILNHLHYHAFRVVAACSETLLLLLCCLYWNTQACRGCFLFMNPNSLCWTPQHPAVIASIARQINLDSATRLLLFSLFITRYTVFN